MTTRREFIGGAAVGAAAFPFGAWAAKPKAPNLSFGVVGPIEATRFDSWAEHLETGLRYFSAKGADAVLVVGDITKSGHIEEMESFANVWNKVFPGGRGSSGRKTELLAVTGDHDIVGWDGRWDGFSEDQLGQQKFSHADNPKKVWKWLFHMDWEPIWRKEIKGYAFIGAQWPCPGQPPVAEYLAKHAGELRGDKPFFFLSHRVPEEGAISLSANAARSGGSDDEWAKAISKFPNAVYIAGGYDHPSLADERAVWQGAYTLLRTGCLSESLFSYDYENMSPHWEALTTQHVMSCDTAMVSQGGGVEYVQVYDDHIKVHRLHVASGCKQTLGAPWILPLPAKAGGEMSDEKRKSRRRAPQFSAGARLDVTFCPTGHPDLGPLFKGKPCLCVTIPRAKTNKVQRSGESCRVYDYVVTAIADGGNPVVRRIAAPGASLPETMANVPGRCVFLMSEFPEKKPIRFSVVPRDCFGLEGKAITKTFSP